MAEDLPQKVIDQMRKAGLPISGSVPFRPKLTTNNRGDSIIDKAVVSVGPKKRKTGYVDEQGRIWIKDHAHGDLPDHWDVQLRGGEAYMRVDQDGNEIGKLGSRETDEELP